MNNAVKEIDAYFKSGNSIPVERATIKRIEWEAAKNQPTQDLANAQSKIARFREALQFVVGTSYIDDAKKIALETLKELNHD